MERIIATKQMRLLNRITAIPLLLVCSLAVLFATFQQRIFQNDELMNRTDETIKEVRRTQRLLLIMESSYNSYVVTRRKEFLSQYQDARSKLPQTFDELENTVRRTGGETQFLELRSAFTEWLLHMESLFGKTFSEGVSIFESPYFQKKGMLLNINMRNAFDNFVNKQLTIRDKQIVEAQEIRENLLIYGMLLIISVAIFLAWFFRKELKRAFQDYEDQAKELEDNRNELRKTLEVRDMALNSRDDFISIASHELNTPLQSLKLQVQMLKRDLVKSHDNFSLEKLNRFLEREDSQINRLSQLVKDMLEITKLGRGNIHIYKEEIDLNSLVKEVLFKLSETIQLSGSNIRLELADNLTGHWDRDRIEQILLNLINNAIKYGEGSPISIRTSSDSGWVRIEIQDKGMGIPLSSQERIFNRFERNISANEISGMGLGLFITRHLVEAHGGHIWVESEGEKKGSNFIVEMPLDNSYQIQPDSLETISPNLQH